MRAQSGIFRVVLMAASIALLATLAMTFAAAVGRLPEALGAFAYWAAPLLTAVVGLLFIRRGMTVGRLFGGFAVAIAIAYPVVQAIYEGPRGTELAMTPFIFLLVPLQLLAPVTAFVAGAWALGTSLLKADKAQ